jgi:hypothetical protein
MLELRETGDFYIKVPLLDNEPTFREGISFFYVQEIVSDEIINESIELFNSEHYWDKMWTLEDAKERFKKGHVFSYITDKDGVLGYMWHEKNYTYNFFVSKRRHNRDILNFVDMNRYHQKQKGFQYEYIYVTGTNLHVLNLFIRKFQGTVIEEKQLLQEVDIIF